MKTRQTQPPDSLGAAPCSVELTKREVIERKLLTALEDDNTVAILASKQDLDVMVAALDYAMLSDKNQTRKARELAAGMKQLRREAFPPNAKLSA